MQGLKDTKELGVGSLMLAGGLGGVAYWGPVYPADVIKSRLQVDDLRKPQYKGMMDCFSRVRAQAMSCTHWALVIACSEFDSDGNLNL